MNVDHRMKVMMEETFGPVVGIMKVKDDDEAIRLMNDSPYGLTASIWTRDMDAAERIGREIETGTVYMNRCDYLDPGLAWTGVKDTGRGATLSKLGYESLTRPKSFHLRDRVRWICAATGIIRPRVRFGAGRISELAEAVKAAGMNNPLFVTDPVLAKMPMTQRLRLASLPARRCSPRSSPIRSKPMSRPASRPSSAGGHDGVVAFGGGSALDVGKLIAFMPGQTRPVWDFEDVGDWWTRADADGDRADRRGADHGRHRLGGRPRRGGHA